MRTITSDEVRKIFRDSNFETSFVRRLFERLGIEDELGRGVETYGRLENSTMLSAEEWAADREDRVTKMQDHAATLDSSGLYDHRSYTCEHGD